MRYAIVIIALLALVSETGQSVAGPCSESFRVGCGK
jgi:hypothetical protein